MTFALAQPLRALFEDEVGRVGLDLGLPEEIAWYQLLPSPGLAICIVGAVDAERLAILREADAIAHEEFTTAGLDREVWQFLVVLRPVSIEDVMTADWSRLPYELLARISTRITNEVRDVNRVTLDITSKPPGTIEWE